MSWIDRIDARLRRMANIVAMVAIAGLMIQCLVIFVDVMLRWLFSSPLLGLEDITKLLVIIVITACFPASFLNRGHIKIEFLGKGLGPRAERLLNAFGSAVLFVFITLIAWQMIVYAVDSTGSGEITWIMRLPVYPAYWIAALVLVACVPIQAVCLVMDAVKAVRAETP